MTLNNKILAHFAVWGVVAGLSLFFVFPKLADNLKDLQKDHADQIEQLNDLKNHAKGIELMQSDIDNIEKQSLHPDSLFTSDVELVNEIKHIEETAQVTAVELDPIGVSGSVTATDKTKSKEQTLVSKSDLVPIPFTVTLRGDFLSSLKFIEYFEHNYFLSPINALTFTVSENRPVETKILSNFYLLKAK